MGMLQKLRAECNGLDFTALGSSQLKSLKDRLAQVLPEEIRCAKDGTDYVLLVQKYREALAENRKLEGENFSSLLTSLLAVGEDGIYSSKLRFLFELIQNVDDCDFPTPDDCRLDIRFDFSHNQIILTYNETGFTPFNVFSITGIGEKAKNLQPDKPQIGEKGIGFKSAFGVASKISIQSGWFSFTLFRDNNTIPVPCDSGHAFQPGTRMTLYAARPGDVQSIYQSLKEAYCTREAIFSKNPLLFLNHLTSLHMYYDSFRSMEFQVTRSEEQSGSPFQIEQDVKLSVHLRDWDNCKEIDETHDIVCTRYTLTAHYSSKACRARFRNDTGKDGMTLQLRAVLPNPAQGQKVDNGALYSYLPTQLRLTVPMAIHVPFKLDASREFVDPQGQNEWFQESCTFLAELLEKTLMHWRFFAKEDIVAYLPNANGSLFEKHYGKEACLTDRPELKGAALLKLPLFCATDGAFYPSSQVVCLSEQEQVEEPEQVHRLLGCRKKLFCSQLPISRLGVEMIHNVRYHLFRRALTEPELTGQVLDYLDKVQFDYADPRLFKGKTIPLELRQIEIMLQHELLWERLRKLGKQALKTSTALGFSIRSEQVFRLTDLLYEGFSLNHVPAVVERYMRSCAETCVLVDITEESYLLCSNAAVLSKHNPKLSFATLCSDIDSKSTFALWVRLQEQYKLLEECVAGKEVSDEDFLQKLYHVRCLVRDTLGRRGYQNYIRLIQQSGTKQGRFLQELVQNADDCRYPENVTPTFSMMQRGNRIVTEYNEVGFSRANLRSITAIGESTKKQLEQGDLNTIGEKGVGFKTVFSSASEVRIYSGAFAFSLSSQEPTIPRILERSKKGAAPGTRMEVTLNDRRAFPDLTEADVLELCLCLRNLKKLQLFRHSVKIEDSKEKRTITINGHIHTFRVFAYPFLVNDSEALTERQQQTHAIKPEQRIVCYLPEKNIPIKYWLYHGLPTTHRVRVPMAIDAPFALTTSREQIDLDSDRWNKLIRSKLYEAIFSILESLKFEQRDRIIRLIRIEVQRHGLTTQYKNGIFDSNFLLDYPFLDRLRISAILPTCDRTYFALPRENRALRFPDVALHRPPEDYAGIDPRSIIDADGKSWEPLINALGCRTVSFREVLPLLKKQIAAHMDDSTFRQKLYEYLRNQGAGDKAAISQLPVIPVFGKTAGQTDYIPWTEGQIFVKRGANVSPGEYWILNEAVLPKSDCEAIFGSNINEMNEEYERNRYNDKLADLVENGDTLQVYYILIAAFKQGTLQKNRSFITLNGLSQYVPLKNELGDIKRGRLFLSEQPRDFFPVEILQRLIVHPDCMEFARQMQCRSLREVTYADLNWHEPLTADDVECLCDESFVHSDEILRCFYRDGLITEEQLADAGKDYLIVRRLERKEEAYAFPSKAVINRSQLISHIRKQWDDPIQIVQEEVTRTVRKGKFGNGKTFELDSNGARQGLLSQYMPENRHDLCFCQMCRRVKPKYLIEVNALELLPDYYFPQMRICLCLDCSKSFTYLLRNRDDIRRQYLDRLKMAYVGTNGIVKIHLDDDHEIWFTGEHIAEIQEILRQRESGRDSR